VRFDALTCSTTCRIRKSRGADLAYLATMPPDQARARRMIHDAVDSDIFIARMAGASQREGRQERRGLPRVKRGPHGPDGHIHALAIQVSSAASTAVTPARLKISAHMAVAFPLGPPDVDDQGVPERDSDQHQGDDDGVK